MEDLSSMSAVQPLLTDLYQLTMAYAYWKSGKCMWYLLSDFVKQKIWEIILCTYWVSQKCSEGENNIFFVLFDRGIYSSRKIKDLCKQNIYPYIRPNQLCLVTFVMILNFDSRYGLHSYAKDRISCKHLTLIHIFLGKQTNIATFDLFFRKNPFKAVCCDTARGR